jgi:putative colanic acid biosynthesis glycosyltransferase
MDRFPLNTLSVSIITVVRNNTAGLSRTMDSVLFQDYPSLEYIVVDGASTDGTRELLERGAERVSRWISEPDSGIYEAMNKGARLASAEYLLFMNAGDCFASSDAISRMLIPRPTAELLWGDCIIHGARGEEYDSARDVIGRLHKQMMVCHQSLFIRRTALLQRPYDESLRIAADYDFFCDRILAGASWEHRPFPVSRIDDKGVSAQVFRTSIREKRRISFARFPGKRVSIIFYYLVLELYMNAKALLKALRGR